MQPIIKLIAQDCKSLSHHVSLLQLLPPSHCWKYQILEPMAKKKRLY